MEENGEFSLVLKQAEEGYLFARKCLYCWYKSHQYRSQMESRLDFYFGLMKADQGEGYYHLGWCYEIGLGYHRDPRRAFDSYNKAYDKFMTSSSLTDSTSLLSLASTALGRCYLNGIGVKQDELKAIQFFQAGIEMNCHFAMLEFGSIFESNEDLLEATRWYQLAANLGNSDAFYFLGRLLAVDGYQQQYLHPYGMNLLPDEEGEGSETLSFSTNNMQISHYYQKSAYLGNINAIKALGFRYVHGQGTHRDIPEAIKYYQLAAMKGDLEAKSILSTLSYQQ